MESIFESLENLNVSEECFNDIISIVEEYIHEVSVSTWKKAAISSLPKREQEAKYARANVTGEGFGALHREIRRNHAAEVAKLPDSNINANKVLKAADKVRDNRINKKKEHINKKCREEDYSGAFEGPEVERSDHADTLCTTKLW